jgi:hypothetical protein
MRLTFKSFVGVFVLAFALLGIGELFARYYLGLGTPPLTMAHPSIEYLYRPNQDVNRFGNHFLVNEYGMRSPSFPQKKAAEEFRIMVFGDSVVNGGNLTDHSELATTILANQLSENLYKKVVVGNISAGSWGPGNWLGYAKEYGFFYANVIILVLSSHDLADNPEFTPLDPNTHPTEPPVSALFEAVTRYLPRYLHVSNEENDGYKTPVVSEATLSRGMRDLSEFLKLAKQVTSKVCLVHHIEREELNSGSFFDADYYLSILSTKYSVPVVSLKQYLKNGVESGKTPYRDKIHLNSYGQQLLVKALHDCIADQHRDHVF